MVINNRNEKPFMSSHRAVVFLASN